MRSVAITALDWKRQLKRTWHTSTTRSGVLENMHTRPTSWLYDWFITTKRFGSKETRRSNAYEINSSKYTNNRANLPQRWVTSNLFHDLFTFTYRGTSYLLSVDCWHTHLIACWFFICSLRVYFQSTSRLSFFLQYLLVCLQYLLVCYVCMLYKINLLAVSNNSWSWLIYG